MTTDLPKWLTNDGTEASMARVLDRIAGRERRLKATAAKPRAPKISRYPHGPLPPARAHWTREAWEAAYPDLDAAWWKPWPDAPLPPQFDMPEFLRRMGEGPDRPALGRYVRDQYRAAHLAAEEVFMWGTMPPTGPQPIPCIPDPDDPDYEGEPMGGIVGYYDEEEERRALMLTGEYFFTVDKP